MENQIELLDEKEVVKMEEINVIYLDKKEVAHMLKCCTTTVDKFRKQGLLKGYGLGRKVLFKKHEVENSLIEI